MVDFYIAGLVYLLLILSFMRRETRAFMTASYSYNICYIEDGFNVRYNLDTIFSYIHFMLVYLSKSNKNLALYIQINFIHIEITLLVHED